MKYPTRLIATEGKAGEIARGMLTDSEMGAPPPTAMGAVWTGLNAQLAPIPHATIAHAGVAQAAGTGLSLLKAGAIATLIGGAGLTAVLVQPNEQAATRAATKSAPSIAAASPTSAASSTIARQMVTAMPPAQVQPPSAASLATSSLVQPTARVVREPPPSAEVEVAAPIPARELAEPKRSRAVTTSSASVGTFSDVGAVGEVPKAKPLASQLLRETALLEQGRAALRAGNSNQAWKTLEQWGAEFPVAQLNQEREALTIELLWRSGRKDLARERIRAFVHDYPKSAHAARLRALLEP